MAAALLMGHAARTAAARETGPADNGYQVSYLAADYVDHNDPSRYGITGDGTEYAMAQRQGDVVVSIPLDQVPDGRYRISMEYSYRGKDTWVQLNAGNTDRWYDIIATAQDRYDVFETYTFRSEAEDGCYPLTEGERLEIVRGDEWIWIHSVTLVREETGYTYTVNADGNAVITGYRGTAEQLAVPARIDGYPVTGIGPGAFLDRDDIREAELPESVETIGQSAFRGCVRLETIALPSDMASIGANAFYECGNLRAITLPDQLEELPPGVFYGCGSLFSATVPPTVTYIGESAFAGTGLKEITIPESVVYVENRAFADCPELSRAAVRGKTTVLGREDADLFLGNPEGMTLYGYPGSTAEEYAAATEENLDSLITPVRFARLDDVNTDRTVDCADVQAALQIASRRGGGPEDFRFTADQNGDGAVTAVDALLLLRKITRQEPDPAKPGPEIFREPVRTMAGKEKDGQTMTGIIQKITLDQAAYDPGEKATITVRLKPGAQIPAGGRLVLTAFHLDQMVGEPICRRITEECAETGTDTFIWRTPDQDYQGYLARVECRDSDGAVIDRATVGVDVSGEWTKFPRYGYLTDYTKNASVSANVDPLKDYHINALQFYDWMYQHHQPAKYNADGSLADTWPALNHAEVSSEKLKEYIRKAKEYHMASMAYNLIYGAYDNYEQDGVSPEWALYDTPDHSSQVRHDLSGLGWGTRYIWIFNPANRAWRDYFLAVQKKALENIGFDGFHGDSIGDFGTKYDYQGNPVRITDTFAGFLNEMKKGMPDRYLAFNTVGAKGHESVNRSDADVIYSELWEGDGFPDLRSVKEIIDVSRTESGGKSLVVPAYMNYQYGQETGGYHNGVFRTPSVKLMDAAVYAAGGSRLELGDGGNMLCNEYFPNKALAMDESLQAWETALSDFIVAYENLLRDGQENCGRRIRISNYAMSGDGESNTIWAFAKTDGTYDVIHMINLLGTDPECGWRDTEAKQNEPMEAEYVRVRYYCGRDVEGAWLASPDRDGGASRRLDISRGSDSNGTYIDFELPSLQYWNMVYLK